MQFTSEREAYAYLERTLAPWFRLIPQVWLRHRLTEKRLRIDYIAVPLGTTAFPCDLIGIEVKPSFPDFRAFTEDLRQCIDYRTCVVDDRRFLQAMGKPLPFVFLYPKPVWNSPIYSGGLWGTVRLAGKFKVGTISEELQTWSGTMAIRFELSGERFWDTVDGSRADSDHFGTAQRVGSA